MRVGSHVETSPQWTRVPMTGILAEIAAKGATQIYPERTHWVALDPPVDGFTLMPFEPQQLQETK